MANATNEKVTATKKISDLITGKEYKVHFFKFGSQTNKKTGAKFLSGSFILEDESGKFWCSTPSENSAYKLVGASTSTVNGLPAKIDSVEITEYNSYKDFKPNLVARELPIQ